MPHLTKRLIDSLAPQPGRDHKVYDDQLTGFGVLVYASGKRSFFVEYGPRGRRRRMVLGAYGLLTPDQARDMARQRLAEAAQGEDPLARREERRAAPRFDAWVAEYLETVALRKKQPRHDRRYLAQAAAVWGSRALPSLTARDVQVELTVQARRGATTANRWLASVRACLEEARRLHLIPQNPAMGLRQYREAPPRARVLDPEEFERAVAAIEALPDPTLRLAFQLLRDLGPRKSEVLRARWEDLDLDGGLWRIPSPKADTPQVVPLSDATMALLRAAPRLGPWVIPGRDPAKPRSDLKRPWQQIRETAALEGVTIHDLRRTFGLHVSRAAGLHVAQKLLRHADIRVTEKVYAPLGIGELREALEQVQKRREGAEQG